MKKFLGEFKEFALRGNVMDLAIGVIIGAAFQAIVTSLTGDIISPAKAATKICPYCCSEISLEAKRCPHCTSVLDNNQSDSI